MGMFDHLGDEIRLPDQEPEKKRKTKKKREVRPYKPLRPLSVVGCVLALLVAAAMLAYGVALLVFRFAGTEAEAIPNTRLDENGAVTDVALTGVASTLQFTFRDAEGALHAGTTSLLGNSAPFGDTVLIRYLPGRPTLYMLSSRTESVMIPLGCLLLSAILTGTAISRFRELRK